jgi:hypothetical protein
MTATAVVRPDLSQRTGLSKSALMDFDICQQRAWFALHKPAEWIPNPDATFGSCVDCGVEVLVECARAGVPIDYRRAFVAAREAQERNGVEIDQREVRHAVRAFADDRKQPPAKLLPCPECGADLRERFKPRGQDRPPGWRCSACAWTTDMDDDPVCHSPRQLAPINEHDWSFCRTQAHIHVPLWDLGEVDGHPDLILASNEVFDVKTAKKRRATARTLELGMYAAMVEEDTGGIVPEVGYLVWVRPGRYWQTITTYVTDFLRAWTYERVSAYVRAVRADELLNKGRDPINWTFPGGPVNGRFCEGCRFNPLYPGDRPCRMAVPEETDDD